MSKIDIRLTDNHLTDEEKENRQKNIEQLQDVTEKAEEEVIEIEKAGLLERVKAKKSLSQKDEENIDEQNVSEPV